MTVKESLRRILISLVFFSFSALLFTAGNSHSQNPAKISENISYKDTKAKKEIHTEFPESPTFHDYLKYAESNNPGLKSAYNKLTAAEEKVAPSGTLPDPQINYTIDDMGSGISAFQHKIEVFQMFPWFGKRTLMRGQAEVDVEISGLSYTLNKRTIRKDVIEAYSEYYYLSRMINITRENMALLSYLENVIRAKYTTGEENQATLAKAQVELGMLEEELQSLNDMKETSKAKLNAILNLPSDYPLPLPETIPDVKLSMSIDSLTIKINEQNPELQAIRMESLKNSKDIDLARKQFYPDFMLGVGTERLMNKPMDGNRNSLMGMFSVTLPLWRSSYSHNVEAAKAQAGSTEKEYENMRNNLVSELKSAFYMYRDSERKINLYRDSLIPKTKNLLAVSQRTFEAGKTDFLDIIDSQRTLIELELNYERAVTDRIQTLAMIETLINENIIPSE